MSSKKNDYISVFDGIPYFGGSKVASTTYLRQLEENKIDVDVFTQDLNTWENKNVSISQYSELKSLSNKEYGVGFYLKNIALSLIYVLSILFTIIKRKRRPLFIVGISGPGVDFPMYAVARIFKVKTVQLVHGPVGKSRLSNHLLKNANIIGYLESESHKIRGIINNKNDPDNKVHIKNTLIQFKNGIDTDSWPTESESNFESLEIFWAASLLKWKRLDVFEAALRIVETKRPIRSCIAYIKPNNTLHDICSKPTTNTFTEIYEQPKNIDSHRRRCNVFVSTSEREPFGLSILEALCAGLCVVIPKDGAYWDTVLTHGVDCFKYTPNSASDLSKTLIRLSDDMKLVKHVSNNGNKISQRYHAKNSYNNLVSATLNLITIKKYC